MFFFYLTNHRRTVTVIIVAEVEDMMMCIINVEEPRISLCILHTNYGNMVQLVLFH